jgi:hypothetical protein
MSWPAWLALLLTAVISLGWSHYRLMDNDEFLVLWTDGVGSLARMVHIQLATPISLDPLVYHSLAHIALKAIHEPQALHPDAFALRLPSLLGYLLMQVCLYKFMRRATAGIAGGDGAAVFAMAFPALTGTLFYAVEGRPYGLLLGLYALALVSWQSAIRVDANRRVALITLAAAVALTLNTHYFGVLLLVPLCGAELYRTFDRGPQALARRRLDWPVVAAIVAGMASLACVLPFEKAAAVYRKHYYNAGEVGWHAITMAYRTLLMDYTHYSMRVQHVLAAVFVLATAAFLWGCYWQMRRRELALGDAEIVFLIGLAALPFFGFLLAHYVTHSYEVRYVLGAVVGIAPLLAMTLMPVFRRDWAGRVVLAGLFVAIAVVGLVRMESERQTTRGIMASLVVSPAMKAELLATPTQTLYIQNLGQFATAAYYEPDAEVRRRMALVYSSDEEMRWRHRDTNALTAMNMQAFTPLTTVQYESLKTQPGEHVFMLFEGGWEWTAEAFAADGAVVTPMGRMLDGQVAAVRFPQ